MAEHRRTLCVYGIPNLTGSQIQYIVTTYCNNIQLVLHFYEMGDFAG